MKTAVIVIDMLKDFLTGALACQRGVAIVPQTEELVSEARKANVPVVFCCDAHTESDPEMALWGKHAMAGTKGAEVIDELAPQKGEYVVPKRNYSGFWQTDLDKILKSMGVDTLIFCGIHTHLCVQHTVADAFFDGYATIVASDATTAFTEEDNIRGKEYMKSTYGTKVMTNKEIFEKLF